MGGEDAVQVRIQVGAQEVRELAAMDWLLASLGNGISFPSHAVVQRRLLSLGPLDTLG